MKGYLIFFIFILFFSTSFKEKVHPYHVGSVEFNYNKKSKAFEITGRFFIDDLENALNKKYGTTSHFGEEKFKAEINENLKKYCAEYLRLKSDNQFVKINYLGYEEDRESVDVFLETIPIKQPKKVEVAASFLYNYFDDQINIVHIIVNGNRKSEKLVFPNRYVFQAF